MKPMHVRIAHLMLLPAMMTLGSACILEAAAGPTPTPQIIVVPGDGGGTAAESSPTPETILELTPTWTLTPQPTNTATTAPVTMTAGQDLSCVTGPHWILYAWVARIEEGETVVLLARSGPDWPDYYYARKSDGKECWAFGASSTISGNAAGLPVREAPPLPQVTFTVENRTYLRVLDIYIRGKDAASWGSNRLGASPLLHGATFHLTLTAGFYDVLIRDHHTGVLFEKHDTPIGPEVSSSVIIFEGRYPVRFHSESASAMCRVSIESLDGTYSADLTIGGDGRISSGEDVTLEGLGGVYDMQFRRCSDDGVGYGIGGAYIGPATATYIIH